MREFQRGNETRLHAKRGGRKICAEIESVRHQKLGKQIGGSDPGATECRTPVLFMAVHRGNWGVAGRGASGKTPSCTQELKVQEACLLLHTDVRRAAWAAGDTFSISIATFSISTTAMKKQSSGPSLVWKMSVHVAFAVKESQ